MNRIVIIGNGFDLAHGLKTSYNHFILDYLKNALDLALQNWTYEDSLLKIERKNNSPITQLLEVEFPSELFQRSKILDFRYTFKSIFWKSCFHELEQLNWVDIENLYYQFLLQLLSVSNKNNVTQLNKEFDSIRQLLIQYLKKVNAQLIVDSKQKKEIINLITDGINPYEISNFYKEGIVINFNYTDTLKYYERDLNYFNFEIVNIHGDTNNPDSVIFGYGDELDAKYSEIENLNENVFFTHIKSFMYLKTNNYKKIFEMINRDKFEVQVYGHSIGTSDRTLFSQIVNHENLDNIKLFYHQKNEIENDFVTKTHELSRHFKDKGKMRLQIVPFESSVPMPQRFMK
jgi:hypothetical protein